MECFFCIDENKQCTPFDFSKISEHLIVTEDSNGKIHVHGPINNTIQIKKFINTILKESKIENFVQEKYKQ